MRQFETFCKRCGRKIIMTLDEKTGRWVPCDTEIHKYIPGGGPFTYVNTEGQKRRGEKTTSYDWDGEWGYRQHRADCATVGRNAV